MSIADQITRITDTAALQSNAIDAARTLLGQKQQIQPTVSALSVTANGVYTAPTGVDGYSPVTVAVPDSGGVEVPNCNGLKEIRYFDFTINPNATGYGTLAAGFIMYISGTKRYLIHGKNEFFDNPSASASWQAIGLVGFVNVSNAGAGRGTFNFTTMSNSGTSNYAAVNSNFAVTNSTGQIAAVRAAIEGDATHQYYYFGTYRIYVFIYEKDYAGSVTVAPADSSLVIVHPDYTSTCSVTYPSE